MSEGNGGRESIRAEEGERERERDNCRERDNHRESESKRVLKLDSESEADCLQPEALLALDGHGRRRCFQI